jgi:superfamily I DNA/RNA helicase
MDTLTDEQARAAHHKNGPACVIAGAGTGKTYTLTERICFLVEKLKIEPSRILVATFTNKATADLYNKIFQRLGEATHRIRISTIDSLIWDLAQSAISKKLTPPTRLVGDAHQRILILDSAWATFGKRDSSFGFGKEWWTENADKASLVNLVELCVRAELGASGEKKSAWSLVRTRLRELESARYLDFSFRLPTTQQLKRTVKLYFDKLQDFGATDYDLLSRRFLRCLRQHKRFGNELASQFDAILVDEFQDTSSVQAEVLLILSGRRRNIWVVGDQCQQIYEWRGAGPDNLVQFLDKTKAKKYYLTGNRRSTQPILDAAFSFLRRRVSSLKRTGMLKLLRSLRTTPGVLQDAEPVYTGTLERALGAVRAMLDSRHDLKPCDVAILSRKLDRTTVKEISEKAERNRLAVQFLSSRADHVMEHVFGRPPNFKWDRALDSLYSHEKIKRIVARSLRKKDFGVLRTLRPLATAAEALDATSQAFTLKEAWPALKKTQDRDISVTPAVVYKPSAIQVMTIHAAKGLEFPVVLLMKFGKGSARSFPNPENQEDSRLAYVGATRAQDLLILIHTNDGPTKTVSAFGKIGETLIPVKRNSRQNEELRIQSRATLASPPVVAATHLDYYEQCPLKFAAYHEGRYLPKWSPAQSMGSRMHKAIEHYLKAGVPRDKQIIAQCFRDGFRYGDSPLRKLSSKTEDRTKYGYQAIVKHIQAISTRILAVEQRYRYVQGRSGQVEGVIDAVIEQHDGIIALKEWKTSSGVKPERERQCQLQARVGAMAMAVQGSMPIQLIEIVPILRPEKTISMRYDESVVDESCQRLEQVFNLETAVEAYVQAQGTEPKGFSTAPQFTKMVNSSMASNG